MNIRSFLSNYITLHFYMQAKKPSFDDFSAQFLFCSVSVDVRGELHVSNYYTTLLILTQTKRPQLWSRRNAVFLLERISFCLSGDYFNMSIG